MENWRHYLSEVSKEQETIKKTFKTLAADPAAEEKLDKVMKEYDRMSKLYPGSDPDDWIEFKNIVNNPSLNISEEELSRQYKIGKKKQEVGDPDAWSWFSNLYKSKTKTKSGSIMKTFVDTVMFGLVIPLMATHNLATGKGVKQTFDMIKRELKRSRR